MLEPSFQSYDRVFSLQLTMFLEILNEKNSKRLRIFERIRNTLQTICIQAIINSEDFRIHLLKNSSKLARFSRVNKQREERRVHHNSQQACKKITDFGLDRIMWKSALYIAIVLMKNSSKKTKKSID